MLAELLRPPARASGARGIAGGFLEVGDPLEHAGERREIAVAAQEEAGGVGVHAQEQLVVGADELPAGGSDPGERRLVFLRRAGAKGDRRDEVGELADLSEEIVAVEERHEGLGSRSERDLGAGPYSARTTMAMPW